MSRLYTIPQLADALGVGYKVVYSLRTRGLLRPFQRNGKREYYRMEDYERAATLSQTSATLLRLPKYAEPSTSRDTLFQTYLRSSK